MRDLTTDTVSLIPVRRKARHAANFKQIRDSACGLYEALEVAPWCCPQRHIHNANLRLDGRLQPSKSVMSETAPDIRFRVLFSQEHR